MPLDRTLCNGNDGILNASLQPSPLLFVLLDKETAWHDSIQHVANFQADGHDDDVARLSTCQDRDATCTAVIARICTRSSMCGDTYALGVALLDNMLATTKIPYKYITVCAIACVHIAAKICEEDTDVTMEEMMAMVGVEYSTQEVLRMERCVLNKCHWDVGLPTAHRFVQLMISLCSCSPSVRVSLEPRLRPVMLLALANHDIVYTYRPSAIALACLQMTLQSMDVPTGANTVSWLASISKTSMADISSITCVLRTPSSPSSRGRCARKRRRRLHSSTVQSQQQQRPVNCYSKKQRAVESKDGVDWLDLDWTPALHLLMGQN